MEYDAAIIGGGPAGSTAATLLARRGHKVIVLEREKFPRFHIGESLLPYSMSALDKLGVREKIEKIALVKRGGEIATSCGTKSMKFYFKNAHRIEHKTAYHVVRADFDKVLLDNAAENGAEVREETGVEKIAFSEDGVALTLHSGEQINARYVIDCSGRNSVISKHFKLKKNYPHLQKFAVFAHYENVLMDGTEDETALTRLIRGGDNWFWMIPVTPTRTSVGVVTDTSLFKKLKKSPEQFIDDAIKGQALMRERMANATRASEIFSTGEYSYRSTQLVGDRWLLAGDAAGFIDPVFSTGVFIALSSGEQTAECVHLALQNPASRKKNFSRYAKRLNRVMDMYLRFVTQWYKHEFVEVFTTPTEHFNLVPVVNSLLAGNVKASFGVWWRMRLFYLIITLQKRFPLCDRLSLPNVAPVAPQ